MKAITISVDTRFGRLAVTEAGGAIVAATWSAHPHPGPATPLLRAAADQIASYGRGELTRFDLPRNMDGVRIETGFRAGDAVTPYYDPLIAKIIAHGPDRATAIARLAAALSETVVEGLVTNRDFLLAVLHDAAFQRGAIWTGYVEAGLDRLLQDAPPLAEGPST